MKLSLLLIFSWFFYSILTTENSKGKKSLGPENDTYKGTVNIEPSEFKNKHETPDDKTEHEHTHDHKHEENHNHEHNHVQTHEHYQNHYHEHEEEHKHRHVHYEMGENYHGHVESYKELHFHQHYSHYPDVFMGKLLADLKHDEEPIVTSYPSMNEKLRLKQNHLRGQRTLNINEYQNSEPIFKYQFLKEELSRYLLKKIGDSLNNNSIQDKIITKETPENFKETFNNEFENFTQFEDNNEVYTYLIRYMKDVFAPSSEINEDQKKAMNDMLMDFYDYLHYILFKKHLFS